MPGFWKMRPSPDETYLANPTYKPGEWSPYTEVKRKLGEDHGIPADQVRFIQEAKTEKSRKAMIQAMNDGKVRVLFGSTEMLGTGVNAQKRCVAIHHLDCSWRPSDLQQRDGRGIRKGNEIAKLYADNKVDVIIYAVEKSLDSYKFNLLHNKQLFITLLKRGSMGTRTIDEGSMDEQGGMNYSEYVAILTGNTDLLDKAKLEKQVTSLESERKAFSRGKSSSEAKLEKIMQDITGNQDKIDRLSKDLQHFNEQVRRDEAGEALNPTVLDGIQSKDVKVLAQKLVEIEDKFRTHGVPEKIGSLYGFDLLAKTETSMKDGFDFIENRFFARGEGNILYNFNYGKLASDPKTAILTFLRAIETIPNLLEKYQKDTERISKDIPVLREVIGATWKKEDRLQQLKSDLAALDRKILLSLKPIEQGEGKGEAPDGQQPSTAQSPPATHPQTEQSREPYVHQKPDFMQKPPEPKITTMPQTISIKDALQNRVVINESRGTGNKDDPEKEKLHKGFKL